MKRLLILTATLIITLIIGVLSINNSVAYSSTKLNTDMFVPASYIEFYDLNSPEDVYYCDGYLIVAEYVEGVNGQPNKSRLVIYDPTLNKYVTNDNIKYSVSCIAKYDEFILLLMDSNVYYLNLSNLTGEPQKTATDFGCSSFSVNNNKLITTKTSTINAYTLSNDNGTLKVDNHTVVSEVQNPINVLFSSNGCIYYLKENNELRIINTTSTDLPITKLTTSVINFTEFNNFIYFTSPDGVYKIHKESPYTLTKIYEVSNQTTLGYIVEPTGITATESSILVADKRLNCVQEISTLDDKFTSFAITTEATCDYRLTASCENLILSENYIYALDNTIDSKKRIVKISINSQNKTYKKIDLSSFYEEYESFEIVSFTASDDLVFINYINTTLTETTYYLGLFKQVDGDVITLEKLYEIENSSVSSLYYLSKEFYYTDKYNAFDANNYININKITYSYDNNGAISVYNKKVTSNTELNGLLIDATIDVFGNHYLIYSQNDVNYLIRYYNGTTTTPTEIDFEIVNIQTDFNGNVYILDNENVIHKYVYNIESKEFNHLEYLINVNIDNLQITDFQLNYLNDCFYALSNACILKSSDNALQIEHLKSISANEVNLQNVTIDLKFIQVNENAKMFKVNINDYLVDGQNYYFKNIEAITNPNTTKIYLVISELENYYLISYSPTFYALVRKTSVEADATLILPENYSNNGISVSDNNGQVKYITNDTYVYTRPIIDDNFAIESLTKNSQVYLLKTITFNNKTLTLISKDDTLTPTGYILNGYLKNELAYDNTTTSNDITIVSDDASRKISNVLAVLAIALAVTVAALILEKKLLFNDKL